MTNSAVLLRVLIMAFCVSCGTTDPSPVGIDLVNLAGGEVVEVFDIRPVEAGSRFREIFPTTLGSAEELLVGRMNGVEYVSLFQVSLSPADFPGGDASTLTLDSLFVELKVLGNLNRGDLGGITVSIPAQPWTETQSFVDTTDFQRASFERIVLADVIPTRVDSTVRIPLPNVLLEEAISRDPGAPVVEFTLSGAEGTDFLIVSGARETGIAGTVTVTPTDAKVPKMLAYFAGQEASLAMGPSLDTYFADRVTGPSPGELLLQTGVLSAATLRFDLPSIPESGTVNQVELIMDFDFNRSFLSSLRLRFERLDVMSGDTTYVTVREQTVAPVSSPFFINLDPLMFYQWMSGRVDNSGLSITPTFDVVSDLRYEWGLFTNPRIRIVYSLPPAIGT